MSGDSDKGISKAFVSFPFLAGSCKGFAFASFTSKAHAERALKLANGKVSCHLKSPLNLLIKSNNAGKLCLEVRKLCVEDQGAVDSN